MESPPLSWPGPVDSMRSTSLEEVEEFFVSYVPLSNLPTPPLQGMDSFPVKPINVSEDGLLGPELVGPAAHLANLVPSNACLQRPSVSVIHDFLLRSGVPDEIIGLAGCILDGLSMRFARSWRQTLRSHNTTRSTPTLKATDYRNTNTRPELIVLSVLSVAAAYLEDRQMPTSWWCQSVGADAFNEREVNATTRCILIDLDYELHSFTSDMVQEMMEDIRRTKGPMGEPASTTMETPRPGRIKHPVLSLQGIATIENGLPTPEPSP